MSTGKHIAKGTLLIRKAAGDSPVEYIKVEMKDIIVTNLSTGGSGSDDRIAESCTLNFGEYKYIYTEQKPDGSKGAAPEFAWDIAASEKEVIPAGPVCWTHSCGKRVQPLSLPAREFNAPLPNPSLRGKTDRPALRKGRDVCDALSIGRSRSWTNAQGEIGMI
ncbi:type VI secretion system tube protein Hcp [Roseibium salinum]|nr:type VI secretion system tube protein Hcp [Roseibium salinum]